MFNLVSQLNLFVGCRLSFEGIDPKKFIGLQCKVRTLITINSLHKYMHI